MSFRTLYRNYKFYENKETKDNKISYFILNRQPIENEYFIFSGVDGLRTDP